ncbi:hypothetical protein EPO17_03335 [Patescibacteria group bacterium]|nr:MAG: hypothetical protein EPO17_03335 [Patescibacteria group bacterium]
MNFEMIVFWVALVAIALIVWSKRVELRTGKASFLSKYGTKTNDTLRYWYRGTRNFFSAKTWALITAWCRTHLARTVSKTEKTIAGSYSAIKKHPRVAKILRGHTEVKSGEGEASPFLKNISEDDSVK